MNSEAAFDFLWRAIHADREAVCKAIREAQDEYHLAVLLTWIVRRSDSRQPIESGKSGKSGKTN